ncbi:MAG: Ig-like domain-containing protein [Treponema sp.]|nr:Ig-like domain-containing protein [Treponema sp.]
MCNRSRFKIIKKLTSLMFLGILLWAMASCGTLMLPPLEVTSCEVGTATIVVEFTLPPDLASLEDGLSVTEDGIKIEGKITISGKKAEFTPLYGIKDNYDYVVRIEAGTEDGQGHSLMDTFVYEYSTRTEKAPFTVDFPVPEKTFSENSLETASHGNVIGGEIHVLDEVSTIQLEFSASVDKKSLETGLTVTPSFEYFLEYEKNDCLVRLVPKKQLEINQRYVVQLKNSVMDTKRNVLEKDMGWSFFYKLDEIPPEITFKHATSTENILFEENSITEIVGDTLELGLEDWIILDFSEKLDLDAAASLISLESLDMGVISPSMEIIKDYKNGNRLALRPQWNGNSRDFWGSHWQLVVKTGLEDGAGNKTTEEKVLFLSYTLESQRPLEFLGALLVDTEKQSGFKACFSPQHPFLSMALDPQFYPNRAEELPSKVELHLFFSLSEKADALNDFSLMENISLSASNDCCELTVKKLLGQDSSQECKNQFQEFMVEMEGLGEEIFSEIADSTSLVMVSFQVELLNRDNSGLVTLELEEAVADSLGNKLGKMIVCQVNKL